MSRIGNAIIMFFGFAWFYTMLGIAHNARHHKREGRKK